MTLRKTGEDSYFAASNSAEGFHSFYAECFDQPRIDHVYAVKGGPGTGKSFFLRRVAEEAERREWKTEYIYCSSDPTSLDGVILTASSRCIALLDATAPHVYEPRLPGAREEIVDLGAFWDAARLEADRAEIEALNQRKGEAYRRAYRYLAGAGEMLAVHDNVVAPYIRRSAIEGLADRLTREIPNGDGYRMQPALIGSIGMLGEVRLDSYLARADTLYLIEDCHGAAQYLLDAIGRRAVEKRAAVRLSYDPLDPNRLDGIFFTASRIAYAVGAREDCPYPCRRVFMRRFVQTAEMKPIRGAAVYAERMRRALLGGAVDELDRVREAHFELEQIYVKAMDFDAKERFTKAFCMRLFDLQNE